MATITGWFDPAPKGGPLRSAAHGYLPAPGDPAVRLPGLRRGDHVTLADGRVTAVNGGPPAGLAERAERSEEHTSELQSRPHLVCRLLLEKKKKTQRRGLTHMERHTHTLEAT